MTLRAVAIVLLASITVACGSNATQDASSQEPSEPSVSSRTSLAPEDRCPPGEREISTDADLVVWMQPEATPDDVEAVRTALDADPRVQRFVYFDKAASHEEFLELFADYPSLVEAVSPEVLPTSYRVYTGDLDDDRDHELQRDLARLDGVHEVLDPEQVGCRLRASGTSLRTRCACAMRGSKPFEESGRSTVSRPSS